MKVIFVRLGRFETEQMINSFEIRGIDLKN